MKKLKVFISSVQKEFAVERIQLFQHFQTDPFLSGFFEPVIFEKLPASSQAPNKVYLDEVKKSQVYMALLGQDYGHEDEKGVSPTEHEYKHARALHLDCLVFIKGESNIVRHEKEHAFISKVQGELSYKRFETIEQLILEVNNAFVTLLKDKGLIQLTSFDESVNLSAEIDDLDASKIENFIGIAGAKRGFPLRQGTSIEKVLTHLHLLPGQKICNSALLVFAREPQQFFPSAVTKCAHFHGFSVVKPIPDHKVFQGDVFEQVDLAVDFVLSKISVSVGMRNNSNQAPIQYEIPRAVVAEAIVNAVAHRDYTSNGSVQVMLFADRLEISNPGRLTPELTLSQLRTDHSSYPTNPRLAEPLYQAGYIERFGTGTGEIFRLTKEAGLKEPEFDLEEGFKVILWRPVSATGQAIDQVTGQVTGEATGEVTGEATGEVAGEATEAIRRIVLVLDGEVKRIEIQEALQLKHQEYFRDNYLIPSIDKGFVEMTIPDKPNSPNQRYRLTQKGILLKKKLEQKN
jgi:ATP-dependent DNA helicase RecG